VLAEKALKPVHRNWLTDLVWSALGLAPPKKVTLVTKERERCPNVSARSRVFFGASDHIHCCKAGGASIKWALRECGSSAADERNAVKNAGWRITAPLEMRPKFFGDKISVRHRYSPDIYAVKGRVGNKFRIRAPASRRIPLVVQSSKSLAPISEREP
jgi:hypothetical protein